MTSAIWWSTCTDTAGTRRAGQRLGGAVAPPRRASNVDDQPDEEELLLSLFLLFLWWWCIFFVELLEELADSEPWANVGIALKLMPATTKQVASATITFFTKISLVECDCRMAAAAHCIRHPASEGRVAPGSLH